MAEDKKITACVAKVTVHDDDVFPIVDLEEAAEADQNKKVSGANMKSQMVAGHKDLTTGVHGVGPGAVAQVPPTFFALNRQWLTVASPSDMHGFEPVRKTNIVEVNKTIDGSSRKYVAYDSNTAGTEIRLYYTDDLDGVWTPYTSNPILTDANFLYRCPSTVYDGITFHMFLWNRYNTRIERWTSTDGITYTYQETISSTVGAFCNVCIWFNPNDSLWYLYHTQWENTTKCAYVRKHSSITSLAGASEYATGLQDYTIWGAFYHHGRYWFVTEGLYDGYSWRIHVFTSASPDSGIIECQNSPILIRDEACPRLAVAPDGSKVYLFSTRRENHADWVQDTWELVEGNAAPTHAGEGHSYGRTGCRVYLGSNILYIATSKQCRVEFNVAHNTRTNQHTYDLGDNYRDGLIFDQERADNNDCSPTNIRDASANFTTVRTHANALRYALVTWSSDAEGTLNVGSGYVTAVQDASNLAIYKTFGDDFANQYYYTIKENWYRCPKQGLYLVTAQITYLTPITDARYNCNLFVNGSATTNNAVHTSHTAACYARAQDLILCEEGDIIFVTAYSANPNDAGQLYGSTAGTYMTVVCLDSPAIVDVA